MTRRDVVLLLFDDVEVLDFAGPFEVFSRTRLEGGVASRRRDDTAPFRVHTASKRGASVRAVGGLTVTPSHDFATAPRGGVLVVPGGFGTRALLDDAETLDAVRSLAAAAEIVTSVCTGALVLARAGLLAHRRATTHWGALELLARLEPTARIERDVRVVEDGVVTSAGVAAGMDMAFRIVERLHGRAIAEETARYIEYPLAAAAGADAP